MLYFFIERLFYYRLLQQHCVRIHGALRQKLWGGVLEILPKKVGNIHVLNTGLLNINPELKRNVISIIDEVVRNGRNIDEALDYIDAKILVGVLRFDEDTCRACRRIWKDIESKAPWQRHKIGSDYNDQHKIYLDQLL